VVITSFGIGLSDFRELRPIDWKVIIVDKNHDCKLVKKMTKELKPWAFRLLLSDDSDGLGYRLLKKNNSPTELGSLLRFLLPEHLPDLESQCALCFKTVENLASKKKSKAVKELHQILTPYLLCRLKKDVEP
jgi:SNF2 family DNA or RNA helicase